MNDKVSYLTSQKLNFKEPKEPRIPNSIIRKEKEFENSGASKMKPLDRKKEIAMSEARKKLENVNFENRLRGKAKEAAKQKRLSKFRIKF